jgi:hypothetical protein
MDKDIKDRWIADLRSGLFKQGKGVLRDKEDHFCCLGILCNQAEEAGIGTWGGSPTGDGIRFVPESGEWNTEVLPEYVATWAGIPKWGSNPNLTGAYRDTTLAAENDRGRSFDEIADLIEKHF